MSEDNFPSKGVILTELGLNQVYGSLVLGGYDASKFKPNNLTFNFGPQDNRELLVELNKITTDDGTSLLQQPVSIFLDSTVPYIYLPEAACAMFESTFGLVWDTATQLYLLTDAQHTSLKAQNPKITFTLGTLTSLQTVDIMLPYSAFDLTVSYPIVANATRYFPLKRANDSSQYTLGRTFFQEAYVIADYDRRNFSVSQCKWDASAVQDIVAIFPPSDSTKDGTKAKSPHHLPLVAIAAGVSGLVLLALILVFLLVILRRKHKARGLKLADEAAPTNANRQSIIKAELDASSPEQKHEVDANPDLKYPSEMSGHEILEIDPYGRKWPPTEEAVEIGTSGKRRIHHEIYEMDAGEVAIEMSGVGNGRRRSRGGRPMSFVEGDDWDRSPGEMMSPRSARFGSGRELVSPVSRTMSPATPVSPAFPR